MKCRRAQSEDKEDIYNVIQKGYPFGSMTHFKWKLKDVQTEYTVVGGHDSIQAVAFFEPQTKVVCVKEAAVFVGGGGALLGVDMEAGYTALMRYAMAMADKHNKALLTYVATNEFTYPVLKKLGFYHLFTQRKYVKIVNVKKMMVIAAEKLNKTGIPPFSLTVRIVPDSEDAFVITVDKGSISVIEDAPADMCVSGDIKSLIACMMGGISASAFVLLFRKKVRITIRFGAIKGIIQLIRVLL